MGRRFNRIVELGMTKLFDETPSQEEVEEGKKLIIGPIQSMGGIILSSLSVEFVSTNVEADLIAVPLTVAGIVVAANGLRKTFDVLNSPTSNTEPDG